MHHLDGSTEPKGLSSLQSKGFSGGPIALSIRAARAALRV